MAWLLRPPGRAYLVLLAIGASHLPWLAASVITAMARKWSGTVTGTALGRGLVQQGDGDFPGLAAVDVKSAHFGRPFRAE